jgi:hypothetical protein
MPHRNKIRTTSSAAAVLLLVATAGGAHAADTTVSSDPRVKFKPGDVYMTDLSDGLAIPRDEICKELGRHDCFKTAFRIVMGGVDPYDMRILTPLDNASLASPIALDRVALHACTLRVARDVETPASAVLFKAPRGHADKAWINRSTTAIYDRVLRRAATPSEKAQMAAFYQTVAKGRKDAPAAADQDFVTLGCFAVASSLEATFY